MSLGFISKLEQGLKEVRQLKSTIWVEKDGLLVEAEIYWQRSGDKPDDVHFTIVDVIGPTIVPGKDCCFGNCESENDLANAFCSVAERLGECKPFWESVNLHVCHLPYARVLWEVKCDDGLYRLIQSVWQEVLTGNHSPIDLNKDGPIDYRKSILPPYLLPLLSQGASGVKLWNETDNKLWDWQPLSLNFKNSDLKGRNLNGIQLGSDFTESQFQNATIENAVLTGNYTRAKFCGANLYQSELVSIKAVGADFSDANLGHTKLESADLRHAIFRNTDLNNASLKKADLRGVDLSMCRGLDTIIFDGAKIDETSFIPVSDSSRRQLVWRGEGPDPVQVAFLESVSELGPMDFPEFIDYLQKNFDKARMKKVLAMLKKERFELFSEVTENEVFGIVKSQTDPDLLYSCGLNSHGNYACCTQNLNACGGLRGSLCKHILVLSIGLVKAAEVDSTSVTKWVLRSTVNKPKLDKGAMTSVFLRYKSSADGEIDWRPTETIPEDFYAY